MYKSPEEARKDLVDFGRKIAERRLVVGPGGNTSAKVVQGGKTIVYLKASGKCFEDAGPSDYIGVDADTAEVVDGKLRPSCEVLMHLACYKARPEAGAVIHTHPIYSTAYAMLGKPLKAFTPDMVAIVGREVPAIPYVPPAGKELADAMGNALKGAYAVLMANHGLLSVGGNMREAWYRSLIVEDSIETLFAAKLFGAMREFTDKEASQIDGLEAEAYRRKLLQE